uniref:YacP-like NYN domain protein n=1 Tax=Musa acuminata subsp. malaccensis TaxID=214687 RepID=A0A804IF40_MUSAM|nr:PREDICTED: uncharacterized protein LOC103979173 isoform X3 [Musa acuminata subsp. malaccensis]
MRGAGREMRLRAAVVSPCCSSPSSPHVVMASCKKSQPKSNNHKNPDQAPPRITSNVKQNLQILRLWKDLQSHKSSTPRPATSYRKKKVVKEELPQDTELYKDPTTNLYYTNQGLDTSVPVLLVDGYNVCGYWAKLKKHFMKGRLDIARQKLIDELIAFSVIKEVKVVVVFDAMTSGLPTHKESFAGIDVIFSSDTCADAWIEKEGAFVWSCKALVSEIKASQREFEQILNEHRSTSVQGKLLQHNLGPEIVDALKDLKRKLSENEST